MTQLDVLTPMPGRVTALTAVPDPVFAQAMVGPGLAIGPVLAGTVTVVAPVSGRLVKLHPHIFVIRAPDGAAVLTHLGIDTVQLSGEGFEAHVSEGDDVVVGDPVTTWNPATIQAGGRSPVVPVVALNAAPDAVVAAGRPGSVIGAGDVLFTWEH